MKGPIRLRDLPGVARIEQMLRVREIVAEPGYPTLLAAVDEVSISLFGITVEDTLWSEQRAEDHPDEWDEYEGNFLNVDEPYTVSAPFWQILGWDVTDGKGNELPSAFWFGRQIIAVEAAASGQMLVEGARFTPDGSGQVVEKTEPIEELDAEEWGARMQDMAENWMKGRAG